MKGLIVDIYKHRGESYSNNGMSKTFEQATLVGEGIVELFEAQDDRPAVRIVRREIFGKPYVHAEPIDQPKGMNGPMFGGCFIYSSDSRFREKGSQYPIPLHDRFEKP